MHTLLLLTSSVTFRAFPELTLLRLCWASSAFPAPSPASGLRLLWCLPAACSWAFQPLTRPALLCIVPTSPAVSWPQSSWKPLPHASVSLLILVMTGYASGSPPGMVIRPPPPDRGQSPETFLVVTGGVEVGQAPGGWGRGMLPSTLTMHRTVSSPSSQQGVILT